MKSVKVYQVVRRQKLWHVLIPDSSPGVHPSDDVAHMVAWACEAAGRVDGEVHVRDLGGQIKVIYTYIDGVQHEGLASARQAERTKR